ncbi:MAG: hypothetical protein K0S78_5876, partial [Thermomicrobiales bacterium]|nr:hypothetical protein [Thermomicrobiales bacterium]MDF3042344.1 hypothetical protein [Thermomicrobiales bacterium]
MREHDNHSSNGRSQPTRRQVLQSSGVLAGAAALLGGARPTFAHDDTTSTLATRSNF